MQGDFIERNTERLSSGLGSCLLVREFGDRFYNLVVPSESVPAIEGEYDTAEYNPLLARAKSKVKLKRDLSAVTMEFSHSPEHMLRLNKLVDKTFDYMRFNKDFTYETYTAEVSYAANDSEYDVLKDTLTIIPSVLGVKGIDGRDLIRQTLEFAGSIPMDIDLNSENNSQSLELAVTQADANATFDIVVQGSDKITATYDNGKITITADGTLTKNAYATVIITAKSEKKMDTEGNEEYLKYAPWITTIAVAYTA